MAARFLILTISLAAIIGATLAVYEDCESPPHVEHSTIEKVETDDAIQVVYSCNTGYELRGGAELICNIDSDEWNTDPPTCVEVNAAPDNENNGADISDRKRKILAIPEDPNVTAEMAQLLDLSCIQAKILAPTITHGVVQKYERRRKGEKLFLVAYYKCNENFEFEADEVKALYCHAKQWVGEVPTCIPINEYTDEGEYDEEDEYDDHGAKDSDYEDDTEDDEDVDTHVRPPPPPPPATVEPTFVEPEPEQIAPIAPAPEQTEQPEQPEQPEVVLSVNHTEESDVVSEEVEEPTVAPVTDISIVVQPTQDPYTPRFLDDNCGPDKGGCAHKCERLLFPGENEPRLKCSCFEGFTLDANDYISCHDIDECQEQNGGCEHICNNLPGAFECACEKGFQIDTLTGNTCVDINECLLRNGHGPCQDTCYNRAPGYICSCDALPGTQLAPDGHSCEDAGECTRNNGNCSHICLASLGRIFCLCPQGFLMSDDGKTCQDINECEQPELTTDCNGGCENTPGSYKCIEPLNTPDEAVEEEEEVEEEEAKVESEDVPHATSTESDIVRIAEKLECGAGFRASSDDSQCLDIDECAEGLSDCEYCLNIAGSYECTCPLGYDLAADEKTCVDINECEIISDIVDPENDVAVPQKTCSHICQNTPGSYICSCGNFHHLLPDKRTCVPDGCKDINNPQLNKTRCAHKCLDLPDGRYECVCPKGYKLDADLHSCVVLENACIREAGHERCRPGTCQPNENDTSFSCLCPPGYSDEIYSCQDIDECAAGTHKCSHNCFNTEGGYQCVCPADMLLANDGLNCIQTDVCAVNNNGCEQICKSSEAGACACEAGYRLSENGKSCHDIDECQEQNNGGCQQLCRNLPGGYECFCAEGFEFLDGALSAYCFDIDECALGTHDCDAGLICENLNGSYTCLCQPGFALGLTAAVTYSDMPDSDIIHTTESPILFSQEQQQPQQPHSEQSSSQQQKPVMHACLDIDECSIGNGNCSHFCLNFPGSYQCACPPGYELSVTDNSTCLLENACLVQNGGCSHICTHTGVTSYCDCPPGYNLDAGGFNCLDVNECIAPHYGNCSGFCINLIGSYVCECDPGYELGADGHSCIDVNECILGTHRCSHECINKPGNYECDCPTGYELDADAQNCVDLNACAVEHGCSHSCTKLQGNDVCQCPEGFLLSTDAKTCIAMLVGCPPGSRQSNDGSGCIALSCAVNKGGCSHICDERYGCDCPLGLVIGADSRTCEDIDECQLSNGGCDYRCKNTFGSFECSCPMGQRLVNGKQCIAECATGYQHSLLEPENCVDIDECEQPGICQYKCLNKPGGYECICPAGYRLEHGRECVDIDECAVDNGGCQHECINQKGSFQCKCPVDQRLAADRRSCIYRTDLRDQCPPFQAPANGEIKCHKYRHKRKRFYNTRCHVRCNAGYQLQGPAQRNCDATGRWDNFENKCLPIRRVASTPAVSFNTPKTFACPALAPPRFGIIQPAACTQRAASVGNTCHLQCQNGYVPVGEILASCMPLLGWSLLGQFDCKPFGFSFSNNPKHTVQHNFINAPTSFVQNRIDAQTVTARPAPYIKCPQNSLIVLNQGQSSARILLQTPVSNVDLRFIEAQPAWAKQSQVHLRPGVHHAIYRARDPQTGQTASCKTTITIQQSAPAQLVSGVPIVDRTPVSNIGTSGSFCTPSFEVSLRANQKLRSVVWEEPRFEGEVLKLYKSHFPGALFREGTHPIQYEATNKDGVTMRCTFKIHVKAADPNSDPSPVAPLRLSYPPVEPLTHQSISIAPSTDSNLLFPGHESYVICPGQQPVKVTSKQSVHLPVGCTLKNVHKTPQQRQYLKRGLLTSNWNPFSKF